jgi:hypothetical protein
MHNLENYKHNKSDFYVKFISTYSSRFKLYIGHFVLFRFINIIMHIESQNNMQFVLMMVSLKEKNERWGTLYFSRNNILHYIGSPG